MSWNYNIKAGIYKLSNNLKKLAHEHPIDGEAYRMYSKKQKLNVVEGDFCKSLHEDGVKIRQIAKRIRKKYNKPVSPRRVRNFLRPKPGVAEKDKDQLQVALNALLEADEKTVIRLNKYEASPETPSAQVGMLRVLSIVTNKMQEDFRENPHVLVVDTTYNTNSSRYPMLCLVAVNYNTGRTAPVGVAFLDSEDTSTVKLALQHMKDSHGDAWKNIQVVLSDRDWPTLSGNFKGLKSLRGN